MCTSSSSSRTIDDSSDDVGYDTAIALDAFSQPHVSYQNGSTGDLLYARRWFGNWELMPVDLSLNSVGLYSSIAVDPSGGARISYQDGTKSDLLYAFGPQELVAVGGDVPTHLPRLSLIPNPSFGAVRIQSSPPANLEGSRLAIFDVRGRLERQLEWQGTGGTLWDGLDAHGARVLPGLHFVRWIDATGQTRGTERIVLLR